MDEVTKALHNSYSMENKGDFFSAYLYMKYTNHFLYNLAKMVGLPVKERTELPEDGIDAMLQSAIQRQLDVCATTDTNVFHAKVVKVDDAVKLVSQKDPVKICPPETVIPFKIARDIVLDNPGSIAVGICACRANSAKPCLPPDKQDVCLIIGDPYASFWAEKNPLFRKCTQAEAIAVIETAHKRGDVSCAYFRKDLGNKFYAICNCCDCCCIGIKSWNMLGGMIPLFAPSGYVAKVSDECNLCGSCEGSCRFGALTLQDNIAEINVAKCMGCGVCEGTCSIGAISLVRDESKGDPLDLDDLKKD